MRRWAHVGVLAGVAAALVALAAPDAPAQGKDKSGMHFELFKDSKNEFRWRLRAKNNRVFATSGDGYKNKSDCEDAIKRVKEAGGKKSGLTFEVFEDRSKEYRWRLKARNNRILAVSADGYKNRSDCENGIDLFKSAGKASVKDLTKT